MSIIASKTCFILKPKNITSYAVVVAMLGIGFDIKIKKLKKGEIRCYTFTVEGCSYIEQIAKDNNCSVKRVSATWEDIDDNQ